MLPACHPFLLLNHHNTHLDSKIEQGLTYMLIRLIILTLLASTLTNKLFAQTDDDKAKSLNVTHNSLRPTLTVAPVRHGLRLRQAQLLVLQALSGQPFPFAV